MSSKEKYNGIDFVKLIMACLVVAIHLTPFAMFGDKIQFIANIITRVAVPFFFCASGFFLKIKLDKSNNKVEYNKNLSGFIKRVLSLYIVWTIIYLPCSIFLIKTDGKSLARYLQECLFDGSYLHLWYLPSLIIAVILSAFVLKKLNLKIALSIAVFLYCIGLFDTCWYGVIKNEFVLHIIDIYDNIFITTRNGLFFGLVFVILGFLAKTSNCSLKKSIIYLGISAIGLFLEMYLLKTMDISRSYEGVLFSIPTTYYLFLMAKNLKLKDSQKYKTMRNVGVLIYFAHCWVDFTYSVLCFNILHRTFNSMVRFGYTMIIVAVFSFIIIRLQKLKQFSWLQKLY